MQVIFLLLQNQEYDNLYILKYNFSLTEQNLAFDIWNCKHLGYKTMSMGSLSNY